MHSITSCSSCTIAIAHKSCSTRVREPNHDTDNMRIEKTRVFELTYILAWTKRALYNPGHKLIKMKSMKLCFLRSQPFQDHFASFPPFFLGCLRTAAFWCRFPCPTHWLPLSLFIF